MKVSSLENTQHFDDVDAGEIAFASISKPSAHSDASDDEEDDNDAGEISAPAKDSTPLFEQFQEEGVLKPRKRARPDKYDPIPVKAKRKKPAKKKKPPKQKAPPPDSPEPPNLKVSIKLNQVPALAKRSRRSNKVTTYSELSDEEQDFPTRIKPSPRLRAPASDSQKVICNRCRRAFHLVHGEGNTENYRCNACLVKLQDEMTSACKVCRQRYIGPDVYCGFCLQRFHRACVTVEDLPLPPPFEVPDNFELVSTKPEKLPHKEHERLQKQLEQHTQLRKMQQDAQHDWICGQCRIPELDEVVTKILDMRTRKHTDKELALLEVHNNELRRKNITPKIPSPEREFYVKYANRSYRHCRWISETSLLKWHPVLLRCFLRRQPDETNAGELDVSEIEDKEDEESEALEDDEDEWTHGVKRVWTQAQRIICSRVGVDGTEYLVKWQGLGYSEITWETAEELKDDQNLIDRYNFFEKFPDLKRTNRPSTTPIVKYKKQPPCIDATGCALHSYQLEGLNWLRHNWSNTRHSILADEMGLGKTIQTVAFLSSLVAENRTLGPFLVCVPLSTLANWEREFEVWAPELNVVSYAGIAPSRQNLRAYELTPNTDASREPGPPKRVKTSETKFHVLLTSYQMVLSDAVALGSIKWQILAVDEAHRLKNSNSKFFKQLEQYHSDFRLLLTGTPLQNNLEELFHLLSFLSPESFNSLEKFQDEFADVSKEEQIDRLHNMLAPHLLRRMKTDVLKDMPEKSEFIVCVDLAPLQKEYYKHILTRNFQALNKGSGQRQVSLLNIMAELKKCCNHPFLFEAARRESEAASTDGPNLPDREGSYAWNLIHGSGKLALLDKMLLKLHKDGHRVLIFSQMTRLLDILEEYLQLRNFQFERIDGRVTGSERQERIDRFNAPNAPQFCFLLSTRAGGLGINLATADTVMIYDSDWNPHNDIQAFSRAHRLGQSNKVMIYRFVTRKTVEERIVELAKKKMMLTHLVVRSGMGSSKGKALLSKSELDDILKFGTADLFKDDEDFKESTIQQRGYALPEAREGIYYDDAAINNLLDRSQEGLVQKEQLANEYLKSFKVASFATQTQEDSAPEEEEEEEEEGDEEE
eukprot:m.205042 g.205042  ORF g.205042 m.205042 type:complete len:1100 (+) comp26041_c0_seq2:232-3531(+)